MGEATVEGVSSGCCACLSMEPSCDPTACADLKTLTLSVPVNGGSCSGKSCKLTDDDMTMSVYGISDACCCDTQAEKESDSCNSVSSFCIKESVPFPSGNQNFRQQLESMWAKSPGLLSLKAARASDMEINVSK